MPELYNAGVEPIIVEHNGTTTILQPCESIRLCAINGEVSLKLFHVKNDRFNVGWYLLNEVFTLEQMRTVLVVNGEYIIQSIFDNSQIKVKSYEYVFDKNTSYQTFVFTRNQCSIYTKSLKVVKEKEIIKKAKFLYLFGGDKTLLPLTGIALVVLLIRMIRMIGVADIPIWFCIMTIAVAFCFVGLLLKYFKSLKLLRKAIKEANILEYMSSPRKEYRRFSDELVQKQLDTNAGDDMYW